MSDTWIDGYCLTCGCVVIETGSDHPNHDYKNTCTNPQCKNFGWHHIGDMEELDYYTHKADDITIPEWQPTKPIIINEIDFGEYGDYVCEAVGCMNNADLLIDNWDGETNCYICNGCYEELLKGEI